MEIKERIQSLVRQIEKNKGVRFTYFLNEEEIFVAQRILKHTKGMEVEFHGGFGNGKRKILMISTVLTEEKGEPQWPMVILKTGVSSFSSITHRDVLGSLMSLNIKRELIGDIVILQEAKEIYIAAHKHCERIIQYELNKIRKERVSFIQVEKEIPTIQDCLTEKTFTVSSLRMDNIVKGIIGGSRSKAIELISQKKVKLDAEIEMKQDKSIVGKSHISIEGYGKFKLLSWEEKTKKDRFIVKIAIYN